MAIIITEESRVLVSLCSCNWTLSTKEFFFSDIS